MTFLRHHHYDNGMGDEEHRGVQRLLLSDSETAASVHFEKQRIRKNGNGQPAIWNAFSELSRIVLYQLNLTSAWGGGRCLPSTSSEASADSVDTFCLAKLLEEFAKG